MPAFPDDKGGDRVRRRVRAVHPASPVRPEARYGVCLPPTTAQSPLGQALFRHYGLDTEAFETNLVLIDGRAYAKLDSVADVCRRLGGRWRLLAALRLLPRPLADWLYDRIARNRYALFGRTDSCMIPPPEWRDRFIDVRARNRP